MPPNWGSVDSEIPQRSMRIMKNKVTIQQVFLSFCLRMRSNKFYRKIDGVYLVCFVVRDLKPKLFLKRHNNFNCVQAVQPKIILEVGIGCNLQPRRGIKKISYSSQTSLL